jgi:hypothetical protein
MIDKWISLRWERGTRYYEVYLHQDLWGDWVLTLWDPHEFTLIVSHRGSVSEGFHGDYG